MHYCDAVLNRVTCDVPLNMWLLLRVIIQIPFACQWDRYPFLWMYKTFCLLRDKNQLLWKDNNPLLVEEIDIHGYEYSDTFWYSYEYSKSLVEDWRDYHPLIWIFYDLLLIRNVQIPFACWLIPTLTNIQIPYASYECWKTLLLLWIFSYPLLVKEIVIFSCEYTQTFCLLRVKNLLLRLSNVTLLEEIDIHDYEYSDTFWWDLLLWIFKESCWRLKGLPSTHMNIQWPVAY